jgi:hypothetical protein
MQVFQSVDTNISKISKNTQISGQRNSYFALKSIIHEEGLRGIYRGYAATLLSYGPFSAFYFVGYEKVSLPN